MSWLLILLYQIVGGPLIADFLKFHHPLPFINHPSPNDEILKEIEPLILLTWRFKSFKKDK